MDGENPIMEGLEWGRRLRYQMLQEVEFRHRMDRERREQQRQQRRDEFDDLKLRLELQDFGAREATPEDVTEATAPRYRMDEAGAMTRIGTGTDIRNRLIRPPDGGQMVLPTLQERRARRLEDAKILANEKAMAEGELVRAKMQASGIAVPERVGSILGLPPGTRVLPEQLDDYIRAAAGLAPKAEKDPGMSVVTTPEGTYRIPRRTGAAAEEVRIEGKPIKRGGRTAAGGLTPYQREQAAQRERQARAKQLADLEKEEAELHEERITLGAPLQSGKMTDKDGKEFDITASERMKLQSRYRAKTERLKKLLKRKIDLGLTTEPEARLEGTAAAAPGGNDPLGIR